MANESKKFALFLCCLMTMQALRLVISTAGFCVVRFHIDCELFNIFISRLVNAVLMSQLFGNWLGDLIVFAASGQLKLYAIATANWAEFICFCSALGCFCAGEQGMLTGFYWSMVLAYFWWKVGEAPCISIGALEVDWYFAGFTLSGVWAACLKGLVMMFVTGDKGIYSETLGHVNVTVVSDVSVVGRRSVKTTVDYRAARSLFAITIVLTSLMCLIWDMIQVAVSDTGRRGNVEALKAERRVWAEETEAAVTSSNNKLAALLRSLGSSVRVGTAQLNFGTAEVNATTGVGGSATAITITVEKVGNAQIGTPEEGTEAGKIKDKLQETGQTWAGKITNVTARGSGQKKLTLTVNVKTEDADGEVLNALKKEAKTRSYKDAATDSDNKLQNAIKNVGGSHQVNVASAEATLDFSGATVDPDWAVNEGGPGGLTIRVTMPGADHAGKIKSEGDKTQETAGKLKEQLGQLIDGEWKITGVTLTGTVKSTSTWVLTVTVSTVDDSGGMTGDKVATKALALASGVVMGAIFAIPGALTFATFGKWCHNGLKVWGFTGAVVGLLAGGIGLGSFAWQGATEGETWVPFFKWGQGEWKTETEKPEENAAVRVAALMGLVVGTATGAVIGVCIGARKGTTKSGLFAGALVGGFFGLWLGEIVNGCLTWNNSMSTLNITQGTDRPAKGWEWAVVTGGFFIVVAGLGTVYSIYPGMAPCSITQFKYFNIIDVCILALSSIGPIVIMGVDLAEEPWRLAATIIAGTKNGKKDGGRDNDAIWRLVGAEGMAVLMTIATLICEGIVISVMQHPHSKMAQKVKSSAFLACFLTILMVSFQLTSTGIGFGCVAAGAGFNDGVYNALSTVTLWTTECCGVFGEGYLTELKKYEPGKWPTQGMGKWDSYRWWRNRAFGNAWEIWKHICTTDLRRDIMLCRQ